MRRVALIENGKVKNTIMVDAKFKPPKGVLAIETEIASIGDSYDGEKFILAESLKHSKGDLIECAKAAFEASIRAGVEIDLADAGEAAQIASIPADFNTRSDLAALMLATQLTASDQEFFLVTKDRVFTLTAHQVIKAHAAVMLHVAESHAILARLIKDIEVEKITSIGEVCG